MKILYFGIILALILFSSCATILNSSHQKIKINHSEKIKIISLTQNSDLIKLSEKPLSVKRMSDPVIVKFVNLSNKSDTFTNQLKPFRSGAYWANLLFYYGAGMIVDEFSEKKNAYLSNVYITDDNFLVKEKRGNSKLYIGTEYSALISKKSTTISVFPFNLFIGYENYHHHNEFFSIEASLGAYISNNHNSNSGDFINGEYGSILTFKNNHIFNNFEAGYGLSILNSSYQNRLGMCISGSHIFKKSFALMLETNLYTFDFNPYQTYLAPHFRVKFLFKIPLNK